MFDTLYSQIGAAFIVLVLGFAFLKGEETERIAAGAYGLGWLASMLVQNDSDLYSTAIRECADLAARDLSGSPCADTRDAEYVDIVENQTAPALLDALQAVRDKAPDAEILVIGYPWILPPTGGCYPAMPVATGDVTYLRELQSVLNAALQRAAEQTGARFVDMAPASEGHDACAPVGQRWIEPRNGASGAAPVHPNATGQQAIADAVAAALE